MDPATALGTLTLSAAASIEDSQDKVEIHKFLKDLSNLVEAQNEEALPTEVKQDMLEAIRQLKETGYYQGVGVDAQDRKCIVNLQGYSEHLMERMLTLMEGSGDIKKFSHLTHAELPATPYCNKPSEPITEGTFKAEQEGDDAIRKTVSTRTDVIHRLLANSNANMGVSYKSQGLACRTEEQQANYKEVCSKQTPEKFHNLELQCAEFPPEISGATYKLGEVIFSVRMAQAVAGEDRTPGIWFGTKNTGPVMKRVDAVRAFMEATLPHDRLVELDTLLPKR
jgi:hypothetical protein